jgi:predicted pyridoxine 5'-phosphate oxidase superfamily flavin-nucleotide-binding protein
VEAEELVDAAAADAEEAFERQQVLAVASSTDDNEDTDNPQGGE